MSHVTNPDEIARSCRNGNQAQETREAPLAKISWIVCLLTIGCSNNVAPKMASRDISDWPTSTPLQTKEVVLPPDALSCGTATMSIHVLGQIHRDSRGLNYNTPEHDDTVDLCQKRLVTTVLRSVQQRGVAHVVVEGEWRGTDPFQPTNLAPAVRAGPTDATSLLPQFRGVHVYGFESAFDHKIGGLYYDEQPRRESQYSDLSAEGDRWFHCCSSAYADALAAVESLQEQISTAEASPPSERREEALRVYRESLDKQKKLVKENAPPNHAPVAGDLSFQAAQGRTLNAINTSLRSLEALQQATLIGCGSNPAELK